MTDLNWKELTTIDDLEAIDRHSIIRPVAIYKHSTRCGISATALNRLRRKWSDDYDLDFYFLDLISHRDVSNEIETRYRVPHESPQILLIRNGDCIYSNSHLGISFEELIDNIQPLSA